MQSIIFFFTVYISMYIATSLRLLELIGAWQSVMRQFQSLQKLVFTYTHKGVLIQGRWMLKLQKQMCSRCSSNNFFYLKENVFPSETFEEENIQVIDIQLSRINIRENEEKYHTEDYFSTKMRAMLAPTNIGGPLKNLFHT